MSANVNSDVEISDHDGILSIRLTDYHARDVTRANSGTFKVGPVEWMAEVVVYKNSHTRTDGVTNYWYNYLMQVSCLLPDDTKYYNCHVKIRHGCWIDSRIYGVTPRLLPSEPSFRESFTHRFTNELPDFRYRITFDRGYGFRDTASKMDIYLQLILDHEVPPIRPLSLDFHSKDASWPSDVTVICGSEEEKLYTNKSILALISPVFRTLLYGDFRERGTDTIVLPETSFDELSELLLHVYPNVQKPITESNIKTLLTMADRYLVDSVTQECEKYLLFYDSKKSLSKPSPMSLSVRSALASEFHLKLLKMECESELSHLLEDNCNLE